MPVKKSRDCGFFKSRQAGDQSFFLQSRIEKVIVNKMSDFEVGSLYVYIYYFNYKYKINIIGFYFYKYYIKVGIEF